MAHLWHFYSSIFKSVTRNSRRMIKTTESRATTAAFSSLNSLDSKKNYPVLDMNDDPVTFFAQNKEGPVKFVHLNQLRTATESNPYKLQMVPFRLVVIMIKCLL